MSEPTGYEGRVQPGTAPSGSARTDLPSPRTPWWITSFSGLTHMAETGPAQSGAADEADTVPPEPENTAALGRVADLPGGTDFGTAVHELLETVDMAAWPSPDEPAADALLDLVGRTLRNYGVSLPNGDQGGQVIEQTHRLICNAVHTDLPDIGPLARVPTARRKPEMEFMLHLQGATVGEMLALLADAGYVIDLPTERQASLLNGLMHGFIDLTVERDGRFFVLDYKTNWLGADFADYSPAGMRDSVRHHRYDLQYLIYAAALHRYLTRRLPDYDPERHLGGVRYLFLRGMRPDAGESGIYSDRPDPALIRRLADLLDPRQSAA